MSHLACCYEWFANDEAERLTRLLTAIGKWKTLAQDEFDSYVEAHERDGNIPDGLYDHFADEAFSLQNTERAMYGTLAVAIASFTEKFVGNICWSKQLAYVTKQGKSIARPTWGDKQRTIEQHLRIQFQNMPGFMGNRRARLLGNCFKHSGGKISQEYASAFGGSTGIEIEFENEGWPQMIEDTRTFLVELSKPL